MKHRQSERGVALIICLFALMLLSGIGLGMMYMADTETSINRNYRDSQQAYFAAVAGLQEARQRLMPGSVFPAPTAMPSSAATTGVVYILNWTAAVPKTKITPWDMDSANPYRDTELCHDNFPGLGLTNKGPNILCDTAVSGSSSTTCSYCTTADSNLPTSLLGTDANLAYRWVRVTLKANSSAVPADTTGLPNSYYVTSKTGDNTIPICWDGTRERPKPIGWVTCDDDPPPDGTTYLKSVYLLTSLAVTPGGSRRMAQMEVANNPPFVTNAAVDSKDHVSLTGQLGVNGYDYCSCNCTTDKKTGITTCVDRVAGKPCDKTKWAIYSNGTVDSPGPSEAIIAGQSPPIAQCKAGAGTGCTWPYDIASLISRFKAGAVDVTTDSNYNWSCTGTPANCGTHSGGTFGVPPDFPPNPVDNPTKAGTPPIAKQTTYIPGSAKLTSGSIGNGILIVDGDLEINGGLQFYGLILVKGVIKFTGGGSDPTNIYGAVLAGEESVDDTKLGGSAVINFNRCALINNTNPQPPALLTTHEATY